MNDDTAASDSGRTRAKRDKYLVSKYCCHPPIGEMPYRITDIKQHCCFFYKSEERFMKALNKFKKEPDFNTRYVLNHSK